MSHLQEASNNITAVIQLENSGRGARRQLHGKRQAQQVAAQRGHAAVANKHLQAIRAACSKQANTVPDIKEFVFVTSFRASGRIEILEKKIRKVKTHQSVPSRWPRVNTHFDP